MKLLLDSALSNHRHGRFFQVQLDGEPISEGPEEGLVLMHGNSFQAMKKDEQDVWWAWCKQPGRTLLLIPPFDAGAIYTNLDWTIEIGSVEDQEGNKSLPALIATETTAVITGADGNFDRPHGDQWRNFTFNTRHYKVHSRSGQFAATCLPLWSITLMDHAVDTRNWLNQLHTNAGEYTEAQDETIDSSEPLNDTDYATLLIAHTWQVGSIDNIHSCLEKSSGLFRISNDDLEASHKKLLGLNLLNTHGPTANGANELLTSPYAIYAEKLAEEYHREAS